MSLFVTKTPLKVTKTPRKVFAVWWLKRHNQVSSSQRLKRLIRAPWTVTKTPQKVLNAIQLQILLAVLKLQHEEIFRFVWSKHIPKRHRNSLVYPWSPETEQGDCHWCHVAGICLVPCLCSGDFISDFLETALKSFDLKYKEKYT